MKSLSLITTIASLFFVTWVISVWMDPQRVCVDSPLVASVSLETSEGDLVSVPACFLLSRLAQPELSHENHLLLEALIQKTEKLEVITFLMTRAWEPLNVQLSFAEPFALRSDYGRLVIGAEHLRSSGVYEKVLLQEILQSAYLTPDRYLLEVVSDFLVSIALNKWVQPAPLIQEGQGESHSFLSHVVSFREYCYSSLKSVFHWDYCVNQNSLLELTEASPGIHDITIWGLRPYFSYHLWENYKSLSLTAKSGAIQSLLNVLETQRFKYPGEVENLGELAHWSREFLKNLVGKDLVTSGHQMYVDKMVDLRDFGDVEVPTNLSAPSESEVIVLKSGENIHLPSLRRVIVSLGEIQVGQLILPTCKNYSFEELASYHAEKVIVLEGCKSGDIEWEKILKTDIARYLKTTKKRFAVFHTDSLRFAIQQGRVSAGELFELGSPEKLKRLFSWTELRWHSQMLAYQPVSDINMITFIR